MAWFNPSTTSIYIPSRTFKLYSIAEFKSRRCFAALPPRPIEVGVSAPQLDEELEKASHIVDELPDNAQIADYVRAKTYIRDWFFKNEPKFIDNGNYKDDSPVYKDPENRTSYEIFGIIKGSFIAVNTTLFKEMLTEKGFSADMVIKQLIADGFLIRDNDGKHFEKKVKYQGRTMRFIAINKDELFAFSF